MSLNITSIEIAASCLVLCQSLFLNPSEKRVNHSESVGIDNDTPRFLSIRQNMDSAVPVADARQTLVKAVRPLHTVDNFKVNSCWPGFNERSNKVRAVCIPWSYVEGHGPMLGNMTTPILRPVSNALLTSRWFPLTVPSSLAQNASRFACLMKASNRSS